jgi:predicted acylesterase/phospholipase RssA
MRIRSRTIGVAWLLVAALGTWSGCTSASRKATDPEVAGPPAPYGPLPGQSGPVMGPDPVLKRPLVLVFGPGAARGYAYAGVLRALADAKIPVGAIVGSDMGAVIGALYGLSPSINGFEWKLLQLKGELFEKKSGGLSGLFKRGDPKARVNSRLKELFAGKDLRESRIPLKVLGADSIHDSGDAASTVGETLVFPTQEGVSYSAPKAFPVSEARALGIGPVVVVDVLDQLESPREDEGQEENEKALRDAFRQSASRSVDELNQADLVIRPNLSKIRLTDFERRSDAAYEGKTAAIGAMKELQGLTGGEGPKDE